MKLNLFSRGHGRNWKKRTQSLKVPHQEKLPYTLHNLEKPKKSKNGQKWTEIVRSGQIWPKKATRKVAIVLVSIIKTHLTAKRTEMAQSGQSIQDAIKRGKNSKTEEQKQLF